jgi:hypothetical protein
VPEFLAREAIEAPIPGQMVHGGWSRHRRLAMGLAPREQRLLAGIEQSLRRSDPRLAARLATFTELTSGSAVPRWECLSPWWLRLRRLALLTAGAAAAVLFVAALVFGQVRYASGASKVTCSVAAGRLSICQPAGRPPGHPGRGPAAARTPSGREAAAWPRR